MRADSAPPRGVVADASFSRVRTPLSFSTREGSSPTHSFHVVNVGLFIGWSILQLAAAHSLFLVHSAHPSSHLSFANSGEGGGLVATPRQVK